MSLLRSRVGSSRFTGRAPVANGSSGPLGQVRVCVRRRKITYAEAFTALYSSIFATAAFLDGRQKDRRTADLERQLEEARRELEVAEHEFAKHQAFVNHRQTKNSRTDGIYDALRGVVNSDLQFRYLDPQNLSPTAISKLGVDDPWLTRAGLRRLRETNYDAVFDSVLRAALESARHRTEARDRREKPREEHPSRRRWREEELAWLVRLWTGQMSPGSLDLMLSGLPEPKAARVEPVRELILEALSEGYPNMSGGVDTTADITRQILQTASRRDISEDSFLGMVCYRLLVYPKEMNINVIDTLIAAFDRLGFHLLAGKTISHYFKKMLPMGTSSQTTALMINHHKETFNSRGFREMLVACMGEDRTRRRLHLKVCEFDLTTPRGQGLARERAEWLRRKGSTNGYSSAFERDGRKLMVARARLRQPEATAIIIGLLHFDKLTEAVAVFLGAVKDGLQLSVAFVNLLIDHCIATLDWQASLDLVMGLLSGDVDMLSHLLYREAYEYDDAKRQGLPVQEPFLVFKIYKLLDIAGLSGFARQTLTHTEPVKRQLSDVCDHPAEGLRIFGIKWRRFWRTLYRLQLTKIRMELQHFIGHGGCVQGTPKQLEDPWPEEAALQIRVQGLARQVEHMEELGRSSHRYWTNLEVDRRFDELGADSLGRLGDLVTWELGSTEKLVADARRCVRDIRLTTVRWREALAEREIFYLSGSVMGAAGRFTLLNIQEVAREAVLIETELLRIRRYVTALRLKAAKRESARVEAELFSILGQSVERQSRLAQQEHAAIEEALREIAGQRQARAAKGAPCPPGIQASEQRPYQQSKTGRAPKRQRVSHGDGQAGKKELRWRQWGGIGGAADMGSGGVGYSHPGTSWILPETISR